MEDDAALLGIVLPEREKPDPLFPVDPDNWQAVTLFCQCSTQWRYGATGGVIGMDYPGVNVVLALQVKAKDRANVFERIQIMESAALAVFKSRQTASA